MENRKQISNEVTEKFVSLYENGESSHSIAEKFNVDHKTVLDHLHKREARIRSKSEAIKIGLAKGVLSP